MTPILILDNEATSVQPGHKIKHARIAKNLIKIPETVKSFQWLQNWIFPSLVHKVK